MPLEIKVVTFNEIVLEVVRLDPVGSVIVNTNHGICDGKHFLRADEK